MTIRKKSPAAKRKTTPRKPKLVKAAADLSCAGF